MNEPFTLSLYETSPLAFLFAHIYILCFLIIGYLALAFTLSIKEETALFYTNDQKTPVSLVLSILTFICLIILRPWEVFNETEWLFSLPKMSAYAVLIAFLFYLREPNLVIKNFFVNKNSIIIFTVFSAWLFFSSLFATNSEQSLSFLIDTHTRTAFIFIPLLLFPFSEKSYELICSLIFIAASTICVVSLIQTWQINGGAENADAVERLKSFGYFSNANDIAALATLALPLSLRAKFPYFSKQLNKSFFLCMLALTICVIVYSRSRGALLGLIASVFIYLEILFSEKLRSKVFLKHFPLFKYKKALFVAFATCGLIGAIFVFRNFMGRSADDLALSTSSRLNYWVTGFNMAVHYPVFGVGPGNYPLFYEQFTDPSAAVEWGKRTAHSTWILLLAEGGFICLALYVLLFGSALYVSWRRRKEYPELITALTGYGVTMTFLSHAYTFFPYLLIALAFKLKPTLKTSSILMIVLALVPSAGFADANVSAVPYGTKIEEISAKDEKNEVSVFSARADITAFMVHLKNSNCALPKFESKVKDVTLNYFFIEKFKIDKNSYTHKKESKEIYDVLIPFDQDDDCRHLKWNSKDQWLWVDVSVNSQAMPGEYVGKIKILKKELPVTFHIADLDIKREDWLPIYSEINPWWVIKAHFPKWNSQGEELAKQYIQLAADHGIYPVKSWFSTFPIVESKKGSLNVDIFSSPQFSSSFKKTILDVVPSHAYVDFQIPEEEKKNSQKLEKRLKAIESTIENNQLKERAVVYLWDEPKKKDYKDIIALSSQIKKLAPSLKIVVTTPKNEELEKSVDIFSIPSTSMLNRSSKMSSETWWYVSCMSHGCEKAEDLGHPDLTLERPASYIRSIGALSVVQQMNGFLYYTLNYAFQFLPQKSFEKSFWQFSGNGDGTLLYPQSKKLFHLEKDIPLPSIRLKLLRQAAIDYAYFSKIKNPKRLSQIASDITHWEKNIPEYERLRIEILNTNKR